MRQVFARMFFGPERNVRLRRAPLAYLGRLAESLLNASSLLIDCVPGQCSTPFCSTTQTASSMPLSWVISTHSTVILFFLPLDQSNFNILHKFCADPSSTPTSVSSSRPPRYLCIGFIEATFQSLQHTATAFPLTIV
jgi:hypothetical protein